jgi:thiamine-phosphate diphosphorylase
MSSQRKDILRRMRLYAVLTEKHCRRAWFEAAGMLLKGGVDVIQLREKELADGELLARARALRRLVDRFPALLIINDRPDIAFLSRADGVHVGQDDLPPEEARRLVGPDVIVGLSTHAPEQAREAESRGADYVGVGPVFATATKGYAAGGGREMVARLCAATCLPTVAIGGITVENCRGVAQAGAQAVAACAALCGAENPCEAARAFREAFEAHDERDA